MGQDDGDIRGYWFARFRLCRVAHRALSFWSVRRRCAALWGARGLASKDSRAIRSLRREDTSSLTGALDSTGRAGRISIALGYRNHRAGVTIRAHRLIIFRFPSLWASAPKPFGVTIFFMTSSASSISISGRAFGVVEAQFSSMWRRMIIHRRPVVSLCHEASFIN